VANSAAIRTTGGIAVRIASSAAVGIASRVNGVASEGL